METLKRGDKGHRVASLQDDLKILGYYRGRLDSDFGPKTQKAVRAFQADHLVTGIADPATLAALERAERAHKSQPGLKPPKGRAGVLAMFGRFEYTEGRHGQIHIDRDWKRRNIVKAKLPIVGNRWIHRMLIPAFTQALAGVVNAGLADEIETFGTFCARHICHDPSKPLSFHSWGIACDVNAFENGYGTQGNMDPAIVRAFESAGFQWGGRWRTCDPMHFQYTS